MSTTTRKPRTTRKVSAAEQERRDAARTATVERMQAQLDTAIAQLDDESHWVETLDIIAQFAAKYSIGNQLLIIAECQHRGFDPTYVQSFNAWKKQGHFVRKGEKGIPIWAPSYRKLTGDEADAVEAKTKRTIARGSDGKSVEKFLRGYRPEYVFDVSQLIDPEAAAAVIPEPLSVRRRIRVGNGPQAQLLVGDDATGALADVIALIQAQGLSFEYVDADTLRGANGMTNGSWVRVRNDVDDAQKVKTAVHELAHNLCGHVLPGYDYVTHRGRAETEAESVAYIVCGALGLDTGTYSAPYVSSWAKGDPEILRSAAQNVTQVAKTILAALEPQDETQASVPVSQQA